MTTYEIAWGVDDSQPTGQPVRLVSSAAELDAVFDEIAAGGQYMVTIYPANGDPDGPSLQVGIGHPKRGFVLWLGVGGRAIGQRAVFTLWRRWRTRRRVPLPDGRCRCGRPMRLHRPR